MDTIFSMPFLYCWPLPMRISAPWEPHSCFLYYYIPRVSRWMLCWVKEWMQVHYKACLSTKQIFEMMKLRWNEQYFLMFFFSFFFFLIWMSRVLVAAHRIFHLCCDVQSFHCSIRTLSCSMWDLVPRPGIEPRPPESGALSLSHWTIREVPKTVF